MTTIAVVDYGMGNLRSVAKALEHVAPEVRVTVTSSAAAILDADRVVFPGQGAMPDCMTYLERAGLRDAVLKVAADRPLFGVCVGEQMLFDSSAEGPTEGLAVLPGRVTRFPLSALDPLDGTRLKVPHMGWNRVRQAGAHPVWNGVPDGSYFYFVHSYYAEPLRADDIVGQTDYGITFTCAVARDNIFATQFHPEKSAAHGLRLYRNFIDWCP